MVIAEERNEGVETMDEWQRKVDEWRQAGVIKRKEWQTSNDEMVCSICGPLAGVIIEIEQKYYGQFDAPPAHVGCRCWISPVPEGDDENQGGIEGHKQLTPEQAVLPRKAEP